MIGQLDSSTRKVTVVGAGVSGLLAAYFLDQNGYEVTLIEEKPSSGGLIRTTKCDYGIAESAAHSLLADSRIFSFFSELGVEWEPLRKEGRARYIFRNGKIRRLPLTFFELLRTFWRALTAVPAADPAPKSLTLEAWGLRYLGSAATQYLLSPFVRGIYGAEPGHISVTAAFPALAIPPGKSLLGHFLFRKREKSEPRQMIAPRYGMGDLISRLEKRLEERLGNRFRKNHPLTSLAELAKDEKGGRANVILTVPADRAAQLIAPESDEALARGLNDLKYASMVSVTAFVARDAVPEQVQGVGVLVPASEKRDCLGILFNSSAFNGRSTDPAKWCSFTLMFGGTANPQWAKASDSEISEAVSRELSGILNIRTKPTHLEIHRWNRAIPCYSNEIENLWEKARSSWASRPGNILFGNYTGEVSLRGMILDARKLAEPRH